MPLSTVNLSVLGIDMTEVNTDLGVFENMALTEIWLSGTVFLGVSYSNLWIMPSYNSFSLPFLKL